jgi:hypothetical protein
MWQQNTITHEEDEIIRTKRIINNKKTVIWGFRRVTVEETILLSCCTVLFGNVFLKFRSNFPPSSGLWVSSRTTHNLEVGDGTFLRNVREHSRNFMGANAPPLFYHHYHHHHVHEWLGVFPVPWSSKWNWSLHLFLGRSMFFVLLVYIVTLVLVSCLCPSAVRDVATFPGTVLFILYIFLPQNSSFWLQRWKGASNKKRNIFSKRLFGLCKDKK